MSADQLLKQATLFLKLATDSEELPPNSKDVGTILKNLSKLETYKARVDYAEKNLDHLSSGSSRVVYTMPGKKEVLKLAKNDRGVAQNKIEAKIKCKYINKTLKACPQGCWKTSPFLDKITEKDFKKLTGLEFKSFGEALSYGLKDISDSDAEKPDDFDKISKHEMYKELIKCGKQYELMPGDLSRISSWGVVDGHPTLLDAGLTRKIYDKFYE